MTSGPRFSSGRSPAVPTRSVPSSVRISQRPYPAAAKLRALSSMASVTSAGDRIAPSNRNRRTSGAVQWASRSAWSSAVTGRRVSRRVVRVWFTSARLPAGTQARPLGAVRRGQAAGPQRGGPAPYYPGLSPARQPEGAIMTTVVLTGGSGKLGRVCLAELLEHGYRVTNVDLVRPPDDPSPFVRADLTDLGH